MLHLWATQEHHFSMMWMFGRLCASVVLPLVFTDASLGSLRWLQLSLLSQIWPDLLYIKFSISIRITRGTSNACIFSVLILVFSSVRASLRHFQDAFTFGEFLNLIGSLMHRFSCHALRVITRYRILFVLVVGIESLEDLMHLQDLLLELLSHVFLRLAILFELISHLQQCLLHGVKDFILAVN